MTQILKKDIEERIYSAAVNEFYEKGYKSTTIRDIARKAEIPLGLVYSYYKNKEELFNSIVKPLYKEICESIKTIDDSISDPFDKFNEIESELILNLFNKRKQCIILFDKSENTKYHDAKDRLINLIEKHIKYHFNKKINNDIDDVFIHIMANNFMESICEIIRHYKSYEWAEKMLKLISIQYYYGVDGLHK